MASAQKKTILNPEEEAKNESKGSGEEEIGKDQLTSLCFFEEILRSQEEQIREQLHKYPDCSICMKQYKVGSQVKMLPGCQHIFHAKCIDHWFGLKGTCPVDRENVTSNLQKELFPNHQSLV